MVQLPVLLVIDLGKFITQFTDYGSVDESEDLAIKTNVESKYILENSWRCCFQNILIRDLSNRYPET